MPERFEHWSIDRYRKYILGKEHLLKGNKYHAERTCGYASKLEATRAQQLRLLERAGAIRNLKEQPVVHLSAAEIRYRPDFAYEEKLGSGWRLVYEDTKGVETERFKIIKKLWAHYGPGVLRVSVRERGEIKMRQEIEELSNDSSSLGAKAP